MMLDFLGEKEAGSTVLAALEGVTRERQIRTPDMGGHSTTQEMAAAVASAVRAAE